MEMRPHSIARRGEDKMRRNGAHAVGEVLRLVDAKM
jgi:hypothetical protein